MENILSEKTTLEDKLETTVYKFQAKEHEVATNILETFKSMQNFFKASYDCLNEMMPKLEEKLKSCPKQSVFGVHLKDHIRLYTCC